MPRSDSCRSHMERVFARLGVSKHWWAKYMMEIPHTLVFGLIMYSMVCKNNQICPILQSCCEYGYQSDQKYWSWDNSEKGSLSTKVASMTSFLASGNHEEFVVKGCIDTVFIFSQCNFRFKLRVLCNTQYGGTVVGNCSKQVTVANSITEAKYVAAFEATKKMLNRTVHSWT